MKELKERNQIMCCVRPTIIPSKAHTALNGMWLLSTSDTEPKQLISTNSG